MADLKKSIKDEMNSTVSCIPAKWNRFTVADGDWMQAKTIDQLMNRDDFLADKIGESNSAWQDALSSESATRYSDDQYLSASISSLSGEFYTFSADDYYPTVTALRYDLNSEIDRATQAESTLSGRISLEETTRSAEDVKLQNQIDKLKAATDVIAVFGTYDEFVAGSGDLGVTDNDTIKVLRDYYYTPSATDEDYESNDDDGFQVYYEWHDPNAKTQHTDWTGWSAIGSLDPYYSVAEIDDYLDQINNEFDSLSATVANNYLSAKGAVHQGKNIVVTEDSTKPEITISTSANVEFTTVSSNGFSGTNISGVNQHDTIDNLFDSAYSGASASAWINDNKPKIAYTADFKGTNSVVTGYGTSAFAGGISSISAKTGNSTALFTGYNVNLQAGEGVGFNYGTNLLTISADGKTYASGNYIQISGNNNSINVTTPLVNSASSGYSAYDWITTKSATLSAGKGIGFVSAGPNILGITADGTTYIRGRCIEISSDNSINLSANVSATSYSSYEGATTNYSACTISSDGIEFIRAGSDTNYPYYRNAFDGTAINIHYDNKHGIIEDVDLKSSTIVYSQTATAPSPTFSVTGNWSNIISASKLTPGSGIEIFHHTNDNAIYLTANKYTYQTTATQGSTVVTIDHEETACSSLELRATYPTYPTEVANNVIVLYNNTAVGSLIPTPPSYSYGQHNNYYLAAQPAGGNSQERHWEPVSSITADCISSNNIDAIITATSVGSRAGYVYLI